MSLLFQISAPALFNEPSVLFKAVCTLANIYQQSKCIDTRLRYDSENLEEELL